MGLIGPNGAGKSTTIRILLGLVHQDSGSVRVLGHRMPAEQVEAKWNIGFASEDMRLYDAMTLGWHMHFIRSVYPKWDEKHAHLLLKRFGLNAEQKIRGLSHGQRVKAMLLLVLARCPRLLVLDEPTTGLDPVARHEILRELTAVMKDEGRSILFSSHNTQDVEHNEDLRGSLGSPMPIWSPTALTVLGSEFSAIAVILAAAFYLQSRKKDFV